MRGLLLAAAVVLASCARNPGWRPASIDEDTSIVFPEFFEREALQVGAESQPYELDGVMLRTIAIAARDFLPPDSKRQSCWDRQESYRYRVIRQGGIVFVRISADPESCNPGPRMLDGGVRYAISTEGRILRRLFDGEPEAPLVPQAADAGLLQPPTDPSIPPGDTSWGEPLSPPPAGWIDGGT